MARNSWLLLLLTIAGLSGCAGYRVAGEVQGGRYALLNGKPDIALDHFKRATESDPHFIYRFSPLQQSVWTYLGRAYYNSGKLSEARKVLERARSQNDDDYLAGLYLGLTLARTENYQKSLHELENGLRGLHAWLEWLTYYALDGHYWDPGRRLRKEMEKDLDMIDGKDLDWPGLIASAEWLGKEFEEEIDRARYDKSFDRRKHDRFFRLSRR